MPIKNVSHTHDQLINYMLENPQATNREIALFFEYTEAWVSTIIHSDAFQDKLKTRQEEVFTRVAADIPQRMGVLAHMAIDRMEEALENCTNPDFALDAFDKVMQRNGYGVAKATTGVSTAVQQNFFLTKDDLSGARQTIIDAGRISTPQPVSQLTHDVE